MGLYPPASILPPPAFCYARRMLSKVVIARGKTARAVIASLRTHAKTLSDKGAQALGPLLAGQERAPDLGFFAELLARQLERRLADLEKADEAHNEELDDDADPRKRRDDAAQALHDALIEVKKSVGTLFGDEWVQKLKLPAEVARDPQPVARVGKDVAKALDKTKLPKPRLAGVKEVSTKPWVSTVKKELKKLEAANDDVAREAREAEATLGAKNRALEAFDASLSAAAGVGNALLELVGDREHAVLRTTSHKKADKDGAGDAGDGDDGAAPG
jgi:hypothetical protein